MLSLFWFFIFAVLAIMLGWLLLRPTASTSENSNSHLQPTLFTLSIGDIVQYLGRDWVVEDRLIYSHSGWEWVEYQLQDGHDIRWLSVEEDDTLAVTLTQTVQDCRLKSPLPPEVINYQGTVYQKIEFGRVEMRRQRFLQRVETGLFYDYKGPEKQVLCVEVWGNEIEVSVGEQLIPYQLVLLPGQGQSVYRQSMLPD